MTRFAMVQRGHNLLGYRLVASLVRWRRFPTVFQVVTLACFLGLLILGWGQFAPEGVPAKQYAKSNLVNLVIWGIW